MKKVLVCPLDWGLGHATRCVPLVWELQKQGAQIIIASSGTALDFLRLEFPALPIFELPPYNPVYPAHGRMLLKMISQAPKFIKVVKREHELIEDLVNRNGVDFVIADNRYGCWSSKARSVFVTHQANLLMPAGFGWLAPLVNNLGDRYIQKFDEVWVPDQPTQGLTHPFVSKKLSRQRFIGWLSRFHRRSGVKAKYDIIALLSGPEPQRTILETLLVSQLKAMSVKSLLVEGNPGRPGWRQEGGLEIVNHLPSSELEEAVLGSDLVIARSGYSTVMDLIALGKRAVFIPTPGQTEQEYLACQLEKRKVAYCTPQDKFNVSDAMAKSKNYTGFADWKGTPNLLENAIEELLGPPTPNT